MRDGKADLSRLAADAGGHTDAKALGLALVGALDRYTSRAGAALFVRQHGVQRDGRALRSDEVAALRGALQSAGVEWHALRWAALQRRTVP